MPNTRRSSIPKSTSPLVIQARESLSKQAQQRYGYKIHHYAEKDFEGGISLNGVRLERLACVKALEGLARSHPRRKTRFLDEFHLIAANLYHADILFSIGHRSLAFQERVDISRSGDGGISRRLEVLDRLEQIAKTLDLAEHSVLTRIMRDMPDHTMAQIWPNRNERNASRDLIKSALHKLAIYYGIIRM